MNKKIRMILISFFTIFLLLSVSSCGNKNKYLDGDLCGTATVDGTNSFSQMRRVFVEHFVYDYNLAKVAEGKEYAAYADTYKEKFIFDEETSTLNKIEVGTDDYVKSHYIFTYYKYANPETKELSVSGKAVEDYIKANVANPDTYLKLIQISAYGVVEGTSEGTTENTELKYSYFNKVNNLNYDNDTINGVPSVAQRMMSHPKSCLVFKDNFVDPTTGVTLTKTTWGDAWDVGLLTGLFVFPMAWFIDLFVELFGASGWAQVGAIIVVTFILKILILLVTFKSQSSTQKMQDIQPEILALQKKYGDNPSQQDKQRMSMEMMGIYQKYGVKPFAPFVSLLITFPLFIAMYRAVMYLAVLRTGNIGGVVLGDALNIYIIGYKAFNVVALIIFLIMAASQILSMKLPQILNSKRMSLEAKQQQKKANMFSNIMMIMILVMGFMMPVTMSIYWIASAIVGAIQSVIMHNINNSNKKGKYKVKQAEREPIKIPQGYKK